MSAGFSVSGRRLRVLGVGQEGVQVRGSEVGACCFEFRMHCMELWFEDKCLSFQVPGLGAALSETQGLTTARLVQEP